MWTVRVHLMSRVRVVKEFSTFVLLVGFEFHMLCMVMWTMMGRVWATCPREGDSSKGWEALDMYVCVCIYIYLFSFFDLGRGPTDVDPTLIHSKLYSINLHNVKHSLISCNPRERMFVA
jgi:hypothetical protein